jgi:hypothetical protein
MEPRLIPEKARVLDGSALKLLAVIFMLIDHTGAVIVSRCPQNVLFTVLGRAVTLYKLMRLVGRVAFPLFAFLLVEGFLHTHDRRRYALRLGVFALLSEVPFDLAFKGKVLEWTHQNVFITLCLGVLGLWALEKFKGHGGKLLLSLLGLFLVALVSRCDYGIKGFGFVLLLYLLRERPISRAVIGAGYLSATWQAGLAFVPIAFYNGERGFIRGKALQYAFYLFYPLHLLLLYCLKVSLFSF